MLNIPAIKAAIRRLNVQPNDRILEIGFGHGVGLVEVFRRIAKGNGSVYGLELSQEMIDSAQRYIVDRLKIPGLGPKIILDKANDPIVLPYLDAFFDGISHTNVFYFWTTLRMTSICRELFRLLRPGGVLVCAMELELLKYLETLDIVHSDECDPMRYISFLEPAGFKDIKVTYELVDNDGISIEDNPSMAKTTDKTKQRNSKVREVMIITAKRPLNDPWLERDPNEVWAQLEQDIKTDVMLEIALSDEIAQPEWLRDNVLSMQFYCPSERKSEFNIDEGITETNTIQDGEQINSILIKDR